MSGATNTPMSASKRGFREIAETIVLVLIIYLAVSLSFEPRPVSGVSMEPGLHTDQRVYLNKLAYVFGMPQRGDVVILHPPPSEHTTEVFIKRVIGLPGDTLVITTDAISVNGHMLHEPYITVNDNCSPITGIPDQCETQTIKLSADHYFVMGDNRPDSSDSRIWGPITREAMVGKAEAVIWPLSDVHSINAYQSAYAGIPEGTQVTHTTAWPVVGIIIFVFALGLVVGYVVLRRNPALGDEMLRRLPLPHAS